MIKRLSPLATSCSSPCSLHRLTAYESVFQHLLQYMEVSSYDLAHVPWRRMTARGEPDDVARAIALTDDLVQVREAILLLCIACLC